MNLGLEELVYPKTTKEFNLSRSEGTPFVTHGNDRALEQIASLGFLDSLDSLLEEWTESVQVHLPDRRDESSSLDSDAKNALVYFDQGMGLLFNNVQAHSTLLTAWLDAIRRDLGISALTIGRCLVYAMPDGKGTAPHFDQNINFVFQVHGIKKWTLARNTHVTDPLVRHTIGFPMDPEMATYTEGEMPDAMPNDTESFELRPGSCLFVPRGYWHSTESEGDSLALNFTFTAPAWVDLFMAALRSRLVLAPGWRKTAEGLSGTNPEGAKREFDQLLEILVEDLPNWNASGILSVTESFSDDEV